MRLFSERNGIKPKKFIQLECMDADLRNSLWNILQENVWNKFRPSHFSGAPGMRDFFVDQPLKSIIKRIWNSHFKFPIDLMPSNWSDLHAKIKGQFFAMEWHEVYEFLEFTMPLLDDLKTDLSKDFTNQCNIVFERECGGYRFISGKIVGITDNEQMAEIEKAFELPYDAITIQLKSALAKLSDRKNPDYRNSIKDSIGAVETTVKIINGNKKGILSDVLPKIRDKVGLHAALEEGFQKLYGYTGDSDGIRHGLMEEANLASEDARYMLVSCSAFINYLISKAQKAKLL